MTNAHSETGHRAVCCQNLMLGALSSRSVLSVLIDALFKRFGLFLNSPCVYMSVCVCVCVRERERERIFQFSGVSRKNLLSNQLYPIFTT